MEMTIIDKLYEQDITIVLWLRYVAVFGSVTKHWQSTLLSSVAFLNQNVLFLKYQRSADLLQNNHEAGLVIIFT